MIGSFAGVTLVTVMVTGAGHFPGALPAQGRLKEAPGYSMNPLRGLATARIRAGIVPADEPVAGSPRRRLCGWTVESSPVGPRPRFFDRARRTVKECNEKVGYIHAKPVKSGLARLP
jgi:hypothetical protein